MSEVFFFPIVSVFTLLHCFGLGAFWAKPMYKNGEDWGKILWMALDSGSTCSMRKPVLLCEVVQRNPPRLLPPSTSKAWPISVGYGQICSEAPSLPCEIVLRPCHCAVLLVTAVLVLEIPQHSEDRETAPSSWNQAWAPMLQAPHAKQTTFSFRQRFWSLIPMALDTQRKIPITGKIRREREEVSMHFSVQLLYFKPYPKSNGSMGILPVTSVGVL